ncbi:tyrosine-type recombinase/integrase [Sinorhizobium meliloti]|uniref:tyrosine-type recombinase/integrase n=1 Tax=Rhizobium meliloti TaxID=382 RepID=UPI001D10AFF1|nr:tyrosine-type recombinase/integrase [Sinorhizobium meliloti]MDE4604603.1 tyrosine-type recombinase/integrase [Sinorhizobium meliloti]UDU21163.1 tyrosine-type recombinase/integrase [Sinorhizobium meliloti]
MFLARTGARVSEVTGVNANDLQLERSHPQVLLRGKGRRDRVIPIPQDLARALTALLAEHGIANHEPRPIFIGTRNERLTRFGATHIVRRAVAQAVTIRPTLAQKPVSPHIFRHSLPTEASPVGRSPFNDPSLARPRTGRHDPPLCRRRCRDDAQRTREGGSRRRSWPPFPTK